MYLGKKIRIMINAGYTNEEIANEIAYRGITADVIKKVREKEETR